jgi:hypothetical protein
MNLARNAYLIGDRRARTTFMSSLLKNVGSIGGLRMRRSFFWAMIIFISLLSTFANALTTEQKLQQWRRGVWLLADGSYTIYTDAHYFVVTASGDSAQANIYCGGSQIRITEKGIARRQTLRIRKLPGGDFTFFKERRFTTGQDSAALKIDMSLFQPGTCNVRDHIIYDSVTEETDEYILLSTCNGDKEKIFSDGRSVYLPLSGGEYWAHRIESW